ncbi:MAG: DsrE family protein [Methanobacteriota archaeon]|nr:MAG: DsrE family protein [Euryarchaeota archaeon]
MADSMLVIVTKPPYGLEDAFAGLRLALAMAVNGLKTSVMMTEDGVFNALAKQRPEALSMPSNVEATVELYDFDVPVYVVREDLLERGISESSLAEGLKVVDRSALRTMPAEHDVVTTF